MNAVETESSLALNLGKRISTMLIQKDINQSEFADLIGSTKGAVSCYLSGVRSPELETLRKIAFALGTTTDFLLGLDDVNTLDTVKEKGEVFVYDLDRDYNGHPTLTARIPLAGDCPLTDSGAYERLLENNFSLSSKAEEYVYMLCATNRKPVAVFELAHGSHCGVDFNMADAMRRVLLSGGDAILLAHNHPDGDESPSRWDFSTTNKVVSLAKQLGVTMAEYLIVSKNGCYSMSRNHPELFENGMCA